MTSICRSLPSLALIGALAAALAGCGGEREAKTAAPLPAPEAAAPEAATPPAPKAPAPAMPTHEAVPGTVEMPEVGQLPSDYPSDIPTYPGATIEMSMSAPGEGLLATFTTTAPTQDVYSFYEDELAKRGWSLSRESDGEHRVVADKEGRNATITIMAVGPTTEIAVSVGPSS